MKMKLLILACLCVGLWSCGTVSESPQPEQSTSAAVQESQETNNEEKTTEEPSLENLEDDCD